MSDQDKRLLPRFAVVAVTTGGKRRFIAYDFATREAHPPVHPSSREEAMGLVGKLAAEAKARGERTSLLRRDIPEPKTERPKKSEPTKQP